MKKLFLILLISLVAFTSTAQNKYQKAAKEAAIATNANPKVIAFQASLKKDLEEIRNKFLVPLTKEDQFDTLTVRFQVSKIYGSKAVVYTYNKHHFEIPTAPRINPFKTVLQEGRDYIMQITYNREIREEKHCSGCSGVVPAGLIWISISPEQALKDAKTLRELSATPEIGYSRSPRYQ